MPDDDAKIDQQRQANQKAGITVISAEQAAASIDPSIGTAPDKRFLGRKPIKPNVGLLATDTREQRLQTEKELLEINIDKIKELMFIESVPNGSRKLFTEFLEVVYGIPKSNSGLIVSELDRRFKAVAKSGKFIDAFRGSKNGKIDDGMEFSSETVDDTEPKKAPLQFRDRPDPKQTPMEFLEEHYGRWLHGNGLYQHVLRKWDKGLMQHLDRRFVGRREELAKVLPNKSAEVDARLGPNAATMSPTERKRALDAIRVKLSP